jgi:cytochrome oxidase Cu insertion factor (SCO1/SenC/PrrC family)
MRVEPWLAASALAVVVPGVLYARRHPSEAGPPVLGQLAPFTLVGESGRALSSADLEGKVWVADFVFLGCTESCPLLTTRMSHLQNLLQEEATQRGGPLPVRLVTFTVDPVNDTPEKLSAYAERWNADPRVWTFATGSLADVQRVVADGFKIAFGKVDNGAGAFEMMHGNYFVVVDGQRKIRGYYSSDRPEEMSHLVRDVVDLAAGGRGPAGAPGAVAAKGGPS